eukprot:Skav220212  [mRNA]  locus=scaffold1600:54195:54602:- [translate_table: standard]
MALNFPTQTLAWRAQASDKHVSSQHVRIYRDNEKRFFVEEPGRDPEDGEASFSRRSDEQPAPSGGFLGHWDLQSHRLRTLAVGPGGSSSGLAVTVRTVPAPGVECCRVLHQQPIGQEPGSDAAWAWWLRYLSIDG